MKTLPGFLFGLYLIYLVKAADFNCPDNSGGQCYDCLYHGGYCHRAGSSVIYKNGVIYTVDANDFNWNVNPKEAMVVENGKIVFVGSNSDALNNYQVQGTWVVDLQNLTVLPGIHDNHMHPLESGNLVAGTCALPPDTRPDDPNLLQAFTTQKCHMQQLCTDWVLGHGHSVWAILDYIYQTGKNPIDILDQYVVDERTGVPLPAIMMEETSHSVWVNSEALYWAGINNSVKDAHGAIYMRDAQGNLNGILLEDAGIEIMEKALDPKVYPCLDQLAYEGLTSSLGLLAQNGITAAVDARCYWGRNHHLAWDKALQNGVLTAKAILSLWAYPQYKDADQIPKLKALFTNDKSSRLRKSQVKVYMDGLIGTRTAAMLPPGYLLDDPDLVPGKNGMNYYTTDRLAQLMTELQDFQSNGDGFNFIIHSIGDAGVRQALDAIEQAQQTLSSGANPRHKLTHVELVDPADRTRFKSLGVIADPQVSNAFTLPWNPSHKHMEELVGHDKGKDGIPVKSLKEAGATVTLSSDWDVSTLNPFVGLSHAINRGTQSVNLKDAVEMYTMNAAYSMDLEDRSGSLEPGKDADFIVIDQNIFDLESTPDKIMNTNVLMTVLEGEEIWKTSPF